MICHCSPQTCLHKCHHRGNLKAVHLFDPISKYKYNDTKSPCHLKSSKLILDNNIITTCT